MEESVRDIFLVLDTACFVGLSYMLTYRYDL